MNRLNSASAVLYGLAGVALLFMLVPLVILILASFSASPIFDLPTKGWSARWYTVLMTMDSFWRSLLVSSQVAAIVAALATSLGAAAALALHFGALRHARALQTFIMSPLMLPGIVLGIALLQSSRYFGLRDAFLLLVIGHTVIAIPFVMRILMASLADFDRNLVDAAQTLGYSYLRTLFVLVLPALLPALFAGATFAFLASFDNYSISLFLSNITARPLPIQMIQYIDEGADPSLAAISTILIVLTAALLLIAERFVGLRRLAGT